MCARVKVCAMLLFVCLLARPLWRWGSCDQVSELAIATLLHVLSPGQLAMDIKGLLVDFPSQW